MTEFWQERHSDNDARTNREAWEAARAIVKDPRGETKEVVQAWETILEITESRSRFEATRLQSMERRLLGRST